MPDTVLDPPIDPSPEDVSVDPIPEPPYDAPPTCEFFEAGVEWSCAGPEYRDATHGLFAAGYDPIMHVIAIYGTGSGDGGPVVATVGRTYRPVVLVLGAYDPVEWVLVREPGAWVVQIVTYGHEPQTVTGADDIPVGDRSGYASYSGYCWPFCPEGSAWRMVEDAEFWTGVEMASFSGCGRCDELTLRHYCREDCDSDVVCDGYECGQVVDCEADCGSCSDDLACIDHSCVSCDPDCTGRSCGTDGCDGSCGTCLPAQVCDDAGRCVEREFFPGCSDITTESLFCMTLAQEYVGMIGTGGPVLVGMDTGSVCSLAGSAPSYLGSTGLDPRSLAWQDGYLYFCGSGFGIPGLIRYSFVDGSWDVAEIPCSSVAMYSDGLLILAGEFITYYASFEHAQRREGMEYPTFFGSEDMTVHDDRVFITSHSSNEIRVYQLPAITYDRTIALEGELDTWTRGISVPADSMLLALSGTTIDVFNTATGGRLDTVDLSSSIHMPTGLVCWTNP